MILSGPGEVGKGVYLQSHLKVDCSAVSSYFLPRMGPFQLTRGGRVLAAEPGHDVVDCWGLDRAGALVSSRPAMDAAHVPPRTIERLG
ncbi:phenol 2-monooxygenase [Micrococcus luteus]|nr:phenol 2-monooxygenase [Micrococcus luteus]